MVYSPGHYPTDCRTERNMQSSAPATTEVTTGRRWYATLWRGNGLYGTQLPGHEGEALGRSHAPLQRQVESKKRNGHTWKLQQMKKIGLCSPETPPEQFSYYNIKILGSQCMNLIEVSVMTRLATTPRNKVTLLLTWRSPRYCSSRWCFWEVIQEFIVCSTCVRICNLRT